MIDIQFVKTEKVYILYDVTDESDQKIVGVFKTEDGAKNYLNNIFDDHESIKYFIDYHYLLD
jgi:hypothetical protein